MRRAHGDSGPCPSAIALGDTGQHRSRATHIVSTSTFGGNASLSDADRAARFAAIHEPCQAAIGGEIARRRGAGQPIVLVALHSFTPAMRGAAQPWHVGVLHHAGNLGFSLACLAELRGEPGLVVGDTEPYRMDLID